MTRALSLTLRGQTLRVPIRRDRRSRRITIHIDASLGGARIVMPLHVATAEAEAALREHQDWVLDRLAALPPRVAFLDGAVIPFRGIDHRLVFRPNERGVAERRDGEIHVFGPPEHLPRRAADWLKRQARNAISPSAMDKAAVADRTVRRISIRDQRSRWGSCSDQGHLSFNWRLVLAPDPVLDYVVAHEVAHLVEMNHSSDFWNVVDRLTPHAPMAKRWLDKNGQGLYRFG